MTRLAFSLAKEKGADVDALLEKSGLSRHQIEDPNARVDVSKQIKFLNLVADAIDDDLLGVHLAQTFDLRRIGLLYYVLASSNTLHEALRRVARYSSIANDAIRLTLHERADTALVFEYVGVPRRSDRHQIEFWVTGLIRACRQISHRQLTAKRVSFVHRRKVTPELRTFFGGEVKFGARADQAIFSSSVGNAAVVSGDPHLNELLLGYCEEALGRQRPRQSSFAHTVENAIVVLLPHGRAHANEVARKLGIGQRTLARRLAAEGLTFSGVLQHLRQDLAKRHLNDKDLSISKIAWLLGYQDASAFTHAFRRWTGRAPRTIRRGLH
jgi:AraC-like DNA-binding protein